MSKQIAIGETLSLKPILRLGMTAEEMETKNITVKFFDEDTVTDTNDIVYQLENYIIY